MGIDNKRIVYCLGVARKMKKLAEQAHPGDKDFANDMFILGLIHEVGFEFTTLDIVANEIGGSALKRNGYKYWEEASHFGIGHCQYKSEALDILNTAILTTSEDGEDISVEEKLEETANSIMGENSIQYGNYKDIATSLKLIPEEK